MAPQTGGCFSARLLLLAPKTGGCFSARLLLLAPKTRFISGTNDGRIFLCRVDAKDLRVLLRRDSLLAPQMGGCFSARVLLSGAKDSIYFWRQRRSNFTSDAKETPDARSEW